MKRGFVNHRDEKRRDGIVIIKGLVENVRIWVSGPF